VWAENSTNEVERDRQKKKRRQMNEAVMADRGRGMEWYEN
jgi:hypothetical protein